MNNLSEKIKSKINDKDLKPKSKIFFNFVSGLIWGAIGVMVIVLGVSFGLFFELVINHDIFAHKRIMPFLQAIPYFWIIIILLAAVLLLIIFRTTHKIYKIKYRFIILGLILLTVVIGFVTYYSGLSNYLQGELENNVGYRRMVPLPQDKWLDPENGYIFGKITETNHEKFFLVDINDQIWKVFYDEETQVPTMVHLVPGFEIKVIGEDLGKHEFEAKTIKPGFDKRPAGLNPFWRPHRLVK